MLAQKPEQHGLHGVNARFLLGVIRFQSRQLRPRARHKLTQLFQLGIGVANWIYSFHLLSIYRGLDALDESAVNFSAAPAFPCLAALPYHFIASEESISTPRPCS